MCFRWVVMVLWLAALPAQAQVQCRMPNGTVITMQFGRCPNDAVQVGGIDKARPAPSAVVDAGASAVSGAGVTPVVTPEPVEDGGMAIGAKVVFVALLVGFVFALSGAVGRSGAVRYCMTCGHEGRTKTVTRGSLLIEIILWLCFLVPGVIYSIWRHTSRHKACGECDGQVLVPPESPAAVVHKRAMADGGGKTTAA
jgi:hypothetical protein